MADDTAFRNAILSRQLAEVHLLFDNISSAQAKAIPAVLPDDPLFNPPDANGVNVPGNNWVEQICGIAWPSFDGASASATDVAKLIRARDMLNLAASPATGASIAFTLMMAGEARDRPPLWRRIRAWAGGGAKDETTGEQFAYSRATLAAQAYPAMRANAWFYRWIWNTLLLFLLTWLVMTCLFSWDVATGSALANRVNDLEAAALSAAKINEQAPKKPPDPGPSPTPTATPDAKPGPTPVPAPAAIPTRKPADDGKVKLGDAQLAASINLRNWLADNHGLRNFLANVTGGDFQPSVISGVGTNVEWATVFLNILAGTVLPIFYGVLGAGTAVLRGLSAKIRDSTLMPRHLPLGGVQLALGAVIGAVIGLFVSPAGGGGAADAGLLGATHLSLSALCFVAGFGVEGVFAALDRLVGRILASDVGK